MAEQGICPSLVWVRVHVHFPPRGAGWELAPTSAQGPPPPPPSPGGPAWAGLLSEAQWGEQCVSESVKQASLVKTPLQAQEKVERTFLVSSGFPNFNIQ